MAYVKDGQLPTGATHPSLGDNKSADGIVGYGILGESGITFGTLLYHNSDGKWYKAIANSEEKMPVQSMATWTERINKTIPILKQGFVRNDSWSFIPGRKLYVDTVTSGIITMVQPTDYRQIVGNVDKDPNIIYFNPEHNVNYGYNNRITIKDLDTDVKALFERQTFNIRFPIWVAGKFTMLRGGKHIRLTILDAWVIISDNADLDQTIEIIGFSDVLYIPNTYGAGVSIPLDIIRGNLLFGEDIIVRAETNKRVTIELLCESDE